MFKLNVLNDCKDLVLFCLNIVKNNPSYRFTINDQLIRSSLSVGSNIAEGCQRKGKDRKRFLDIALGSLEECRFQISIYEKDYLSVIEHKIEKIRCDVIKLKSIPTPTPPPSPSPSQ